MTIKKKNYYNYLDVSSIEEDLITFVVLSMSEDKIRMIDNLGGFYLVNDSRSLKYIYIYENEKILNNKQEDFCNKIEVLMCSQFNNFKRGTAYEI